MYIKLNVEEIVPWQFLVCEFYGLETCFCWSADKLVACPYTKDKSAARNVRVLSTPDPVWKIQCYDGRAFLVCAPQGIYKLSRNSEFAVLSKNALAMGAEYWQVIVSYQNGIYLDNKQTKSSRLLFQCSTTSGRQVTDEVHALPLDLKITELHFANCLARCQLSVDYQARWNLCILAYNQKLFVLRENTAELVYTSHSIIVNLTLVKRGDKIAGVLLHLVDAVDTVILVHSGNCNLAFEKVHLGRNGRDISILCAGFSSQWRMENVIWIMSCDQFGIYYVRKDLSTDGLIQQTQVDKRTFKCMQHYKADVILGLSRDNELVEFSIERMESSLSVSKEVGLCTDMFQKTDLIMEKICVKIKQLNVLYENLTDERDKLKRLSLYASKQRLNTNPHIEVSRLCNRLYLTLSIPDKLPKNSHMMFTCISRNRNIFCIKQVTDMMLTLKMMINDNDMLCSSVISMDLITLMDEQLPWCLIRDFINYPSQNIKRKRGTKDKSVFINTKIMSLRNLIQDKDLNMTKLCEIKKIIRAEL